MCVTTHSTFLLHDRAASAAINGDMLGLEVRSDVAYERDAPQHDDHRPIIEMMVRRATATVAHPASELAMTKEVLRNG